MATYFLGCSEIPNSTDPYSVGMPSPPPVHVSIFGGLSGSEDRGGGDNSIQFINIGRVDDKSFKEWRRKIGGWKGGWQQYFDFFMLLAKEKMPL